jgi:parallel beta-helix repeat protein
MSARKLIWHVSLVSILLAWVPNAVQAVCTVAVLNRGGSISLQQAIDGASPGQTINLPAGTCDDNVTIHENKERITIDGGGAATINGIDTTRATIGIRGRGIVITGLTVTGGENGIGIARGGTATISNSTIQNTGRTGIAVTQSSNMRITNSTVQNNALHGIHILESSSARLGFLTFEGIDTIPGGVGPVTIQNNGTGADGGDGVLVNRSASAIIIDNNISNNNGHGVQVSRASHADISSNDINSNTGNGINVTENSGVNLGADSGTELDQLPNNTTANNTGFGINCGSNSYANGRQGTLNGTAGATNFAGSCVNSLLP